MPNAVPHGWTLTAAEEKPLGCLMNKQLTGKVMVLEAQPIRTTHGYCLLNIEASLHWLLTSLLWLHC